MDPKKKIFFAVILASAAGSAAWACNIVPQAGPAPAVKSAAVTTSLTADNGAPAPEAAAAESAPEAAQTTSPASEAADVKTSVQPSAAKCECACEKAGPGAQNAPASQPAQAAGAAVKTEKGTQERARGDERTGACPFRKTTDTKTDTASGPSTGTNAGANENAETKTGTATDANPGTDTGSGATTGTTADTGSSTDSNASFRQQFLSLINAHRAANGKGALAYDALIDRAATNHSAWMQTTGTFSHTGEAGSRFYQRCQAVGTSCDAENIAWGFTSAQMLFDMWKNSPGHNANMLGNHTVMGLGIVGRYATNDFR